MNNIMEIISATLILTWPFMWIWNYAVVNALTIANPITYWTAFWFTLFLIVLLDKD